jgi:hypothetical protein
MSQSNVEFEMRNTKFPTPSATPVKVVNVTDATYGSLCMDGYVTGATAVSLALTASEGYVGQFAVGCTMRDTTNNGFYQNVGTASAPSFTEITS